MQKIDLDRLNKQHVLAYWPDHMKYPGYVDQCGKCLKVWPCDVRQLLDLIKLRDDLIDILQEKLVGQDAVVDPDEEIL